MRVAMNVAALAAMEAGVETLVRRSPLPRRPITPLLRRSHVREGSKSAIPCGPYHDTRQAKNLGLSIGAQTGASTWTNFWAAASLRASQVNCENKRRRLFKGQGCNRRAAAGRQQRTI